MQRKMRRQERQLTQEKTEEILRENGVGVLATVDEDGQPYGVPLNYIYRQGCIYFHCATEGYKLDNINFENRVCFTVYGNVRVIPERFSTAYESAIAFGRAQLIDGEEKLDVLEAFITTFTPELAEQGSAMIEKVAPETAVVKVTMDHLTGKHNE